MKSFSIANNSSFKKIVLTQGDEHFWAAKILTSCPGIYKLVIALAVFFLVNGAPCFSQNEPVKNQDYLNVLKARSEKIVNTLGINDSTTYKKVVGIVTNQYYSLNQLQDQAKADIKNIKSGQHGRVADSLIKLAEEKKSLQLKQLHTAYISQLNNYLTPVQVEKVKDGMTYNILNVTYNAYQNMILTLTETEKNRIYNWLKEARELAMDEGSSEDKHKVFGKYKGRINNYLSAEGYDMKQEEKAWQERLKQKG